MTRLAFLLLLWPGLLFAQPAHVDSLGAWTEGITVYSDSAQSATAYVFQGGQSVTIIADTVWVGCPNLGDHHFTIREFAARARRIATGQDTAFVPFHERYQCVDVLRPLWQHRSGTP